MRAPAESDDTPPLRTLSLSAVIGLALGVFITALLWLSIPGKIIAPLFLASLVAGMVFAFLLLRKHTTFPSWLRALAVLATVSLAYLFPELFRPVCGATPRAFALPAARCGRCVDFVCEWNYKKHKEWCYCNEWDTTGCTQTQPPAIQAALNCSQWGQNGWCTGSLSLDLSAVEPQGMGVMISGEVDGTPFSCPASPASSTCSVPLPEREDIAYYTATSASGLTASGSTFYKHDSLQPLIDGLLNGVGGNNGWFISTVDVHASALDPGSGSGIAAFEYNLNGGGWVTYTGPLNFSDGVHSLSLRAIDAAGNIVETIQVIQVDTISPILDLSIAGTTGANGWYVSSAEVNVTADDTTSGLETLEVSLDGGPWNTFTTSILFHDGVYNYQFRAIDQAGNLIETPLHILSIDTVPPVIDLPASWKLGQIIPFNLEDEGSGLAVVRLVIEDEDERYPKVSSEESLSGYKYKGEIDWNGRFRDGTPASPGGEYYAWLKVTDNAGNESMQAGQIFVEADSPPSGDSSTVLLTNVNDPNLTNSLDQSALASLPPLTSIPPVSSYGSRSNAIPPSNAQSGIIRFSAGGMSDSPATTSQSGVLWGATAAAVVGAFAAEIARRKQGEEAAERAQQAKRLARTEKINKDQPEPLTGKQLTNAYQASLNNFRSILNKARVSGMSEVEATRLKETVAKTGKIGAALGTAQEFIASKVAEARARKQAKIATRKENLLEPEIPMGPAYFPPDMSWKKQDYAQLEHARETSKINSHSSGTKLSILSSLENRLTQLAFKSPIYKLAQENEKVNKLFLNITSVSGDSLRSIADPSRNPRMADGHNQMWNGIAAWQAIFDMRRDAIEYTKRAISERRWKDAQVGVSALAKQSLTLAAGSVAATAIAAWSIITTPVRIFTHDIPEFYRAGKERMEGKDRFWDVILTGTNLVGDITSLYGGYQVAGRYNTVRKINYTAAEKIGIGRIQRVYKYGNTEYVYRYNPYKKTALGFLEDLEGVPPKEFNLLKDIPEEIYRNTTIQSDFLKDIARSKIEPTYFSDPKLNKKRVFSNIEHRFLTKLRGIYSDWWKNPLGNRWEAIFGGSFSELARR